ncbi:hypothetical protein Tco_1443415 [Tanacetum coccineum]
MGAKNIRRTEHEVQNRCDDKTVDITDYEDIDQEDGELPNLPTFFVTNVFASVCEQMDENIDISVAGEMEEVQAEDFQMDENHDVCSLETLTRLHSSTRAIEWFKRPVAYAKCNRDSYESELAIQVDAHGVVLGWLLAARKPFKPD